MPPRNDVRVGELSSKLNIGARRRNERGPGVAEGNVEEASGGCDGEKERATLRTCLFPGTAR